MFLWLAAIINLADKAFTSFSWKPSIYILFIGKSTSPDTPMSNTKGANCYKQITDFELSNQIQGPHNFTLGNSLSKKQNQQEFAFQYYFDKNGLNRFLFSWGTSIWKSYTLRQKQIPKRHNKPVSFIKHNRLQESYLRH